MLNKHFATIAAGGFCLSLIGAAPSQAMNEIFDTTVSSCTTANCSSIILGGTILAFGAVDPTRWEANVYAGAGECIRLDVTAMAAGADDEMVVIAPDGTVFRNDDFGGTLRPRVAFVAALRGWYHVSIGRFNGAAAPEHNFTFAYGRYTPGTNPNCATPTTPFLAPASSALKPNAQAVGDNFGPTAPGGH